MLDTVTGVVGSIGQSLGAVLGLTRHGRLRRQMRDTIHLMDLASKHALLSETERMLAQSVEAQARDLLVLTRYEPGRKWDWSGFLVGAAITGGLASAEWFVWRNSWGIATALQWVVLIALGVVVLAAISSTFSQLFERRTGIRPTDLPDHWSTGGMPPRETSPTSSH